MMKPDDNLWFVCRKVATDYQPYGDRERRRNEVAEDCSNGCRYFAPLEGPTGFEWGVCVNKNGPRAGLLTFHRQGCPAFEGDTKPDAIVPGAPPVEFTSTEAGPMPDSPQTDQSEPMSKRTVSVDWIQLSLAFERFDSGLGIETRTFLDTTNGEILFLCSEEEDYEELQDRIDAGEIGRYVEIEPLETHEEFRIMEDFAVSEKNHTISSRLRDALSRNKPFSRFKDIVFSERTLRDRWNAFHENALVEHARGVLEIQGIEVKFVRPNPQ